MGFTIDNKMDMIPKEERVLRPETVDDTRSGSFRTTAKELLSHEEVMRKIEKAARTKLPQDECEPYIGP